MWGIPFAHCSWGIPFAHCSGVEFLRNFEKNSRNIQIFFCYFSLLCLKESRHIEGQEFRYSCAHCKHSTSCAVEVEELTKNREKIEKILIFFFNLFRSLGLKERIETKRLKESGRKLLDLAVHFSYLRGYCARWLRVGF